MASVTPRVWVIPKRGDGSLWMSDIVPVLSTPTVSGVTSNAATGGVTVSRSGGTLYAVVTGSATQPSVAQIKAGQNNTGTAAIKAANQLISTSGAKSFTFTGLSGAGSMYVHYVHNVGGFDSNIATTAAFQLVSSSPVWNAIPDRPLTDRAGTYPKNILQNVKSSYLINPSGVSGTTSLANSSFADLKYNETLDKITLDSDPGVDVIFTPRMLFTYNAVTSPSAQVDWVARSTAPGVVWAHDFVNAAEVTNFTTDPATTITYEPTSGITAGALVINIPSNAPRQTITGVSAFSQFAATVTLATPHDCIVGDPLHILGLPAPWTGLNDAAGGAGGAVTKWNVTVVNSTTSLRIATPGFDTTGRAAYSGSSSSVSAQRSRVGYGDWLRPLSALTGASNGIGTNDPGITNLAMPARTWPAFNINRTYQWKRDWYGHASYQSYLDTFQDVNGTAQSGNYRGSDYWIQFRMKIDGSRVQDWNAAIRNTDTLKAFGTCGNVSSTHEIVFYDSNCTGGGYSTQLAVNGGGALQGYTGQGNTHAFQKNNVLQPGDDYGATCVGSPYPNWPGNVNACFRWPSDEWVTVLMHVIPGPHVGGWAGWPSPSSAAVATGFQIWVCPQSRINSMVAAGQAPTYLNIYNTTGSTGWPFAYDNPPGSSINNNDSAPAFNMIWLMTYQNAIQQTYGWKRRFCQIIFKKGNGGNNPTTDGIPCPQV